jgi:16S rRNA (uracil1498-N3)-methyltransferase
VYLPDAGRTAGAPSEAIGRVVPLPDDEAHHLLRVLRRRAGDDVIVFDGRGREWSARVATAGRKDAALRIGDERVAAVEPPVAVSLAIGVLKGDQMDTVVRDATALGVRRILPIVSAHVTVPERAWRSDSARARWTRVAIAAARQCRRAVVPDVDPVVSFDSCLDRRADVTLYMAIEPERSVAPRGGDDPRPASAMVLVGPEGGWSEREVERARDAGARTIDLGPRTLRAELVPAVALSALWTRWGWR